MVGETESKALGPGACNVIDGQQRLLTLSLIVAAIRDALVEDSAPRDELTENYLVFPKTHQLRLAPSQVDRDVYEKIIFGEAVEGADRQSLVYKAYAYVLSELNAGYSEDAEPEPGDEDLEEVSASSEDIDQEGGDELAAGAADVKPFDWAPLLEVVSHDLELVSISGVPAERAYQIFATLNHGGLRLTQVDLIRNAVFMKLPTKNNEAYGDLWKPLEERLGLVGLERFMHNWIIRQGHNVPKKDTYENLLLELKPAGPDEGAIFELLQTLKSDADLFILINEPSSFEGRKIAKDWSLPDGMHRSLKFLAEWGNVPAQPLLMEVVSRWRAKDISSTLAGKLLSAVESLIVRRFIAQTPPNDLRSILARLVVQSRKATGKAYGDAVLTELLRPTVRWPTDDELEEAMVTRPLYRPKNTNQTFLVLRRVAEELEGKECPNIEFGRSATKYSVEHILPQTLDGTSWIKDMESWGDLDAHQTWSSRRHTVGNLTLTAYNSELSNRAFVEKKQWIKEKLKLRLSAQLLEQEIWTKPQIESRSSSIAKMAAEIWLSPESLR